MVWIICSPVPGQVLNVDRVISKTALGHQQDLHPVCIKNVNRCRDGMPKSMQTRQG